MKFTIHKLLVMWPSWLWSWWKESIYLSGNPKFQSFWFLSGFP